MGWYKLDVPVNHPQFGKFQRCQCQVGRQQLSAQIRQRMAEFGMQPAAHLTFATFDTTWHPAATVAAEAAQAFARNPSRCLMLWGPPGTGKSHLSMAVVNALLDAGREVLAFTAPDLLDMLRSGFDDGAYQRLLNAAKKVGVLVIDDLGMQKGGAWVEEKLFQLLDCRYRELLPLLISTNHAPDDFIKQLADRLCDERWSLRVYVNAPSYRRRK